jgi:hypothetical protein
MLPPKVVASQLSRALPLLPADLVARHYAATGIQALVRGRRSRSAFVRVPPRVLARIRAGLAALLPGCFECLRHYAGVRREWRQQPESWCRLDLLRTAVGRHEAADTLRDIVDECHAGEWGHVVGYHSPSRCTPHHRYQALPDAATVRAAIDAAAGGGTYAELYRYEHVRREMLDPAAWTVATPGDLRAILAECEDGQWGRRLAR